MSRDHGNNPGEILSEAEKHERSVVLLDSVRTFSDNVYPRIKSLLDVLADKKNNLNSTSKHELVVLIGEIISCSCLKNSNLNFLKSRDRNVVTQAEHDLNNLSAGLFGIVDLVRMDVASNPQWSVGSDMDEHLSDLRTIYENWPGFAIALEDVLLHEQKLDLDAERVGQRSLDLDFLLAGISQLVNSQAAGGRLKKLFEQQTLPDLNGILKPDEQIISQLAVVGNSVFNELNNASKEVVDARHLNLDIKRDGDKLRLRIVDDGIGMSFHQLDPNSPKYIFGKGEQSSDTGSTGIGLAESPKRLEKLANGQLRVWSRRRDDLRAPYNTYPPDSQMEIPVNVVKDSASNDLVDNFVSTVFEISLPITKKAA